MSLKNIFRETNFGNASTKNQDDQLIIESRDTVKEVIKSDNEIIPNIDFSNPKNFAKFGSAQEYYSSTIENIYKNYPYDGSKKEKQEFYNNLALYEKYIFDKEYPRSTGHVHLTQNQYISIDLSLKNAAEQRQASDGIAYDPENYINNPLYLNSIEGNTVEFWYKQDSTSNSGYLFDLSGSDGQRLSIYHSASNLCVTYQSSSGGITGSLGENSCSLGNNINWSTLKNEWHHYSFTFQSASNGIKVTTIIDGDDDRSPNSTFYSVITGSSGVNKFSTKGLKAAIGSSVTGTFLTHGYFDEFKFWTKARNSKWVSQTWFTKIDAGLESVDTKNDLGFYYRFNEGIISSTKNEFYDKIVLDYSGHSLNGEIKNYNYLYSPKSTDSAFNKSGFFDFEEEKDIIIFSSNPLVQNYISEKNTIAIDYDTTNTGQFFFLFPEWIQDQDRLANQELKKLTQVISSYLDKLYLQIEFLNQLKYDDYQVNNEKAIPFGKYLLESKSIMAPEIFSDASLIEEVFARNEEKPLEDTLSNIKNLIYKNIYNNLTYIYKSKGTEKSYRNLFRSFGIDEEILKFNVYSNNSEIDISKQKINYSTAKVSLVDFSYKNSHNANVYQITSSYNSINNPSAIITSSFNRYKFLPTTLECQVLFPNIDIKKDLFNWNMTNLSSSIFGIHAANSTGSDMTWGSNDKCNFQVYAVRDGYASKNVKFILKTNGFGLSSTTLSSSLYFDVYDNSRWNFAVRIKPNIDDYAVITSSNFSIPNYILEFYGVQSNGDIIQNQFLLTQSLSTLQAQSASLENKRIYIGAHRTNYTGSVLQQSDIKILNTRYWLNYLTDETIQQHAKDFNVYAPNYSSKKAFLGFITGSSTTEEINEIDTLLLNWNFSSVTSSNTLGQFNIKDLKISTNINNSISDTIKYYDGLANNFSVNSTDVIDVEYLSIGKILYPENLSTSDTIKILKEDDIFYTSDSRPEETFISIENSMYSIISDEMMKMFASVNDFNNLICSPINVYKKEYRELNYLKTLFFEKVQETPNFERYLKLFKWIDSSIGEIIKQIAPAGAEVTSQISTIIESHILERNKFERRMPLFQFAQKFGIYPIKSINELLYNWKDGHALLNTDSQDFTDIYGQSSKQFVIWLKDRAERTNSLVTSGNSTVDLERQKLLNVIVNTNNQTSYNLKDENGNVYTISNYFLKKAAKPYRIIADLTAITGRKKIIRGI